MQSEHQTQRRDVEADKKNRIKDPSERKRKPEEEKENQWQSPELIGQWCIFRYDDELYPGIILNIHETHVQVKCMHHVGSKQFSWPHQDDILWHLCDDVLELIQPPQLVT